MQESSEAYITRDQLATIVKRAAELDSKHLSLFTEAELRGISSEVGIGDATLNQALHEFLALRTLGSEPEQRPRHAWIGAKSTLLGVATGGIVMLAVGGRHWIPMPVWVPLAVPLYFAVRSKRLRPHLMFQLQNAGYWLGIASTYVLVGRSVSLEVAEMTLASIIPTALLGGVIVFVKNRWSRRSTGSGPQSSIMSCEAQLPEGAAARKSFAQRWLEALLRRAKSMLVMQRTARRGPATATR